MKTTVPFKSQIVQDVPPGNEGVIDWLLACPEKDYLVPIDSESTDTV